MKRMECACGTRVFFDSDRCLACGRGLAFDPTGDTMVAFDPESPPLLCTNRYTHLACNWASEDGGQCLSCRTSRVIPGQHIPDNRERWRLLERAKRRLIRDLLALGLPVDASRLAFEFKEDHRTNSEVLDEHVTTGHASGVITINAAEADDVFREQMRVTMREPYRTLLGHMRHESGHCYFPLLVGPADIDEARRLFGDERTDYAGALQRYYDEGPAADWSQRCVSAYASAHPAEDWAETWAHFLHLSALVESAEAEGFVQRDPGVDWHDHAVGIAVGLNELMRSLGLPDAWPFATPAPVAEKLDFIRRIVRGASR
jgi:hypothetical protein